MEPFVGAHGVPAFIAALYDRTVKTPSQVIDKLSPQYHYSGVQPAHLLLQRLFVACLVRYLNGKGHPDHPELRASGLVEDDQFITRQDDVALRSQMFLKAVSDTWAVPLDPDWSIKVSTLRSSSAQYSLTVLFIQIRFNRDIVNKMDTVLFIHTCFYAVDVEISCSLEDSLTRPNALAAVEVATDFDSWIHTQLLSSDAHYNRG